MKLTTIEAKTLPEAWFLCIKGLGDSTILGGTSKPDRGVHVYTIDSGSFAGHKRLLKV